MNEYTALLLIPLLNLKKSTGICTATRIYYQSVKIKNFAMVSIGKSRNWNKKPNILIGNTVFWNQEFNLQFHLLFTISGMFARNTKFSKK